MGEVLAATAASGKVPSTGAKGSEPGAATSRCHMQGAEGGQTCSPGALNIHVGAQRPWQGPHSGPGHRRDLQFPRHCAQVTKVVSVSPPPPQEVALKQMCLEGSVFTSVKSSKAPQAGGQLREPRRPAMTLYKSKEPGPSRDEWLWLLLDPQDVLLSRLPEAQGQAG